MAKLMQQRIKKLLSEDMKYRISDTNLMARIWYDDLIAQGKLISEMTAVDLLIQMKEGNLTNWETATRVRRKLQAKHKELREEGVYKGRIEEADKWRKRFSPKNEYVFEETT